MRRYLISSALIAVTCITGILPAQDILTIRADREANLELVSKMQGKWQLVGYQKDGERVAPDETGIARVSIRENRLVVTTPQDDAEVLNFTVDTAKTPNSIDLTKLDSKGKVQTLRGIVEQNGDTLRLAINIEPADRPTSFRDVNRLHVVLMDLRRVK